MLWNKAKCFVGQHHRDGRLAQFDGEIFVSRCKYCGIAMAKDFERGWMPVEGARHRPKGDPINSTLLEEQHDQP